ncbi:MAG: ferrous iron transporter B [Candidatus Omnitrophica bacterium]|nr:ferrous iron transporter B [Candidatus Omnitrophota bacterium]
MDRTGKRLKKIALIGNPNVGKSVLFSRLTGVRVLVSNYPGTTVELLEGYLTVDKELVKVVDLPGTYSLEASAPAEKVTVNMLKEEIDLVVNVIDACNLERNLYLTMELLESGAAMIVALNMFDELRHCGVALDVKKLEQLLGARVIPTSGMTGLGIKDLKEELFQAKSRKSSKHTNEQRWVRIGKIIEEVQQLSHRHHNLLELLEDASVTHFWGMAIAALVIISSFKFIRFIGEGLINYILDPFFNNFYRPVIQRLSVFLGPGGFWHNVLVGKVIDGKIDFQQSLGLLTTAPYVEFVMVLPYILAFYLLLSFLEDSGYLPRLALLLDNVMHKLGLHGFAIIPVLLGFGCNVPGILGTRILESERERFIASTLISIGVPCVALQAMIFGVLGGFGGYFVFLVYAILFCVWLCLGAILNYFLKGYSPELLIEIPPYRVPSLKLMSKKVFFRVRGFIFEALPIVLLSVLVINILQQIKVFEFISIIFGPVLRVLFGLPKEAIWALIIGLLRKDIAAGMLAGLGLNVKQLMISCVVLSMSFPCIATFIIFFKELGIKRLLQGILIMGIVTAVVGTAMNMLLP